MHTGQQPGLAENAEQGVDVPGQLRAQRCADRAQLGLYQQCVVMRREAPVGLAVDHFEHRQAGDEKRPFAGHGLDNRGALALHFPGQRLARAQPGRQHQAVLHPGENPRNRAQGFDTAVLLAARGPRGQRQGRQFALGGGLAKIPGKGRRLAHHGAVGRAGGAREPIHHLAPGRPGRRRGRAVRLQNRAGVQRQGVHRQPRHTELGANHFALLGDAQSAGQGPGRLRQQRLARRRPAAANRAAAAVEQLQAHAGLAGDLQQRFLGAVLGPGRSQNARVLGRIRVADHNHLPRLQGAVLAIQGKQFAHHLRRAIEIVQGFEQRRHGQADRRLGAPGGLEQQAHGEHVRHLAGHRDDVAGQRAGGLRHHRRAGGQHFASLVAGRPIPGQQGAPAGQFVEQPAAALRLAPLPITAQAQVFGNFAQRLAVPLRVLADIHAHQVEPEAAHLAQ